MGINLHEKLLEIKQDYKNLTNNNSEQINIISNKILDVFEYEYATLLKSENPNYSELKEFIMCFIYGRFKKQLKFNLWTAMAFYTQTELTNHVKNVMRYKYPTKTKKHER